MYKLLILFSFGLFAHLSSIAQSKEDSLEKLFVVTTSMLNKSIVESTTYLQRKAQTDKTNATLYANLSSALDRITSLSFTCLNNLRKMMESPKNNNVVKGYLKEFRNYAYLLNQAVLSEKPENFRQTLVFVDEDLNLKYDGALASSSDQSPTLVKVHVRVFDSTGSRELAGYKVFIKPEKSVDPDLVEQLNPTIRAEKMILPGRKLIWIENKGVKIDQRTEGIRKSSVPPDPIDFVVKQ